MSSDFGRDGSRPDTAIAPDLAEGVLASILMSLVSIARCTDGTAALLARSRRPNIPVAARVPSSDPVRRLEDKLLGESRASTIRGELAIGRGSSRHTLVFGRSTWDRNHDAVKRIGGEAPGRRAHSQERCQHHGLNPDKTVLIPDTRAGCSLADSIAPADVRLLRARYPGVPVVMYVNTSAAVKAESDICCTSGNAAKVIASLGVPRVIML